DARASSHPDDVRELRLPKSRREGIDHAAPEVFRRRREPRCTEQVVCNDVGIDDRPHSRPPVIQASISFDSGRRDCRAQEASICLRTESRSATCCSRMSLTCCSMDLFCRLARRFKLFTTRAGTSLIVKVAPRALMLAVCYHDSEVSMTCGQTPTVPTLWRRRALRLTPRISPGPPNDPRAGLEQPLDPAPESHRS